MSSQMSIEGVSNIPFALPHKPVGVPESPLEGSDSTVTTPPKSPRSCLSPDSEDENNLPLTSDLAPSTAAMDFYEKLVRETAESGLDAQELIAKSYSDVDWCQYVPRDEDGQLMSLGSIPHAAHACGTNCRPCSCFRKGRCYKLEQCMYCHFKHSRSWDRARGNKESSKHRRDRRKRNADKKCVSADYEENLLSATPKLELNADQSSPPKAVVPGPKSKALGMVDGSVDYVEDLQSAALQADWSSPPKVLSPVPWRVIASFHIVACEFTEQECEVSYDSSVWPVFDGIDTSLPLEVCGDVTPRVFMTPPPEDVNADYGIHPWLLPIYQDSQLSH